MARFPTRTPRTNVRQQMAAHVERQRAFWVGIGRDSPYLHRIYDAQAERWRSDEPIELHAWELPDELRGEFKAGARVVVLGDGTIIPADRHEPDGPGDLRAV